MPDLSPLEARVLGVLVEKERTVPDTYPLSLNALTLGCNQKNNRDPLMQATEAEVQAAVDALRPLSLVIESSGSRVMRHAHNLGRVLRVPDPAVALLAALMLRGPQTPGELRIATERLHRFADLGEVEAALRELAERAGADARPLVVQLARVPGAREQRWAHLLSGPVEVESRPASAAAAAKSSVPDATSADIATLKAEVARLATETAELRAIVERLARNLAAPR
ncbi:MAG TPA: YceH family protein [Burkholderiales bacterium]|nr:YceH family protein [Burkholderiales bacterium]